MVFPAFEGEVFEFLNPSTLMRLGPFGKANFMAYDFYSEHGFHWYYCLCSVAYVALGGTGVALLTLRADSARGRER